MTRRPLVVLATIPLAVVLAGCGPADDPDRCIPPSPSPTGAPWVEADDGEACVPGPDGTWVEQPDGHRVVVPPARRATTVTVRPTTRANPPAQQPVRRAPKARSRR